MPMFDTYASWTIQKSWCWSFSLEFYERLESYFLASFINLVSEEGREC